MEVSSFNSILMYNIFCDNEDICMYCEGCIKCNTPVAVYYVTNCPDTELYAGSLENFDELNKKFISVVKSLFPDVTRIECVSSVRNTIYLDKNTFVIPWEFIKFEL